MTALVLAILHGIGVLLAAALLIVVVLFILGVIAMVMLCAYFRRETNGYQQRYRLPKQRAPKRTLTLTPENRDPNIVGDVSQARWPKATYPHSRANVKGEG